MKVCPQCFKTYQDTENYCLDHGLKLDFISDSKEEETVIIPTIPTQLVICGNCGTKSKADSKFCKNCGMTLTTVHQPIHIPLNSPNDQQQPTIVVQNAPPTGQPALSSFQPSHLLASSQSDNTVKYVVGGLGILVVLFFAGVLLYPSGKSKETGKSSANKSAKSGSDSDESSANSKPGKLSPLVGKTAYLQVNANLRDCPDRSCPSVGVHFENAELKILEVQEKGNGIPWYKVKVVEYGCHTLNNSWCGKQFSTDKDDSNYRTYPLDSDENAQDVGWVISYSKDLGKDVVRY